MSKVEIEIKKLKLRVDEIYDWMVLTQNKTMEKLIKQLDKQRKLIDKLEKRL